MVLENILRLQATESPIPGTVTTPEIINTFHKADMDSLPMFCVGGASLLVLSVSYERDEAESGQMWPILCSVSSPGD